MKQKMKNKKVNNIIAIGGMIAAGKTTLVDELAKELNAKKVYELDDNDEIQKMLLEKQYEKGKTSAITAQFYFLLNNHANYYKYAQEEKDIIVDRTIFEDYLFAYQNMIDEPTTFEAYKKLWYAKTEELVKNVGVPKLYVIIDLDWETFKERLFKRNRGIETNNYERNEKYFKKLNESYVNFLKEKCDEFNINHIVLDVKTSIGDKIKIIKNELNKIEKEKKNG